MTIMRSCAVAGVGLWLLLAAATSDAGGVDGGYTMSTSTDPGGPVPEWIDISVAGTLVTGLADDNSAAGTIPLPTSFRYFAATYSSLKIGSNGWVSFSNTSNIAACFPTIPTAGGPSDEYLAPYMADLNFTGAGNPGQVRTFHDAPENRFIVSYLSVPYWSVNAPGWTGSTNFQVVLDLASGVIRFNYQSLTPPPLNAGCNDLSVGIEGSGGLGLAYTHDTAVPAPFSIVFTPAATTIDVAPTSGLITDEDGTVAVFDVVLSSVPTADVFVPVSSGDTSEGTVAVSGLTFTPANWSTPQVVTVTGADDDIVDGPVPYSIVLGAATSTDPGYDAFDPADVALTNDDDDSAGVTLVPPASAVTTEAGGSASFTLVLTAQPAADVVIPIASNDTTEGTVSAASVTFTDADWDVPQTIIVTGVDDFEVDGDVGFVVVTGSASSADPVFDGLASADVALTNNDDDSASLTISDAEIVEGTGVNPQITFSVTLDTAVAGGFAVAYGTADGSATAPGDYSVAAGSLDFVGTAGEVRTLQVTVVGDTTAEPTESFVVNLGTPSNPAVTLADGQGSGTITDDDAADLSLSLSDAPDPLAAGGNLSYTAVVSNAGPGDAAVVTVTLPLPAGTSFVSGSVSGGGTCAGSPVLCTLDGSLVPGSPRTATIVVAVHPSVVSGTTIEASASVSSAVADPNPANNGAGTTTTVLTGVFADGFEDAAAPLQIELGSNGSKSIAVPLLDVLATAVPHRVVTAAVLLQHGERIGLVQVHCDALTCEARVLRLGLGGAWHADMWTRVEDEPLPLRITVARRELIDVQYGN